MHEWLRQAAFPHGITDFPACQAACFFLLVCVPGLASGTPYLPASDEDVLVRLRPAADPVTRELRELRSQLANSPEDPALAVQLAWRYLEVGRQRAEPRYTGYAQSVLSPWWSVVNAPAEILVLRATIYQRQHDFDRALADLDRAVAVRPTDAQAWLSRAAILEITGDYAGAMHSCLPLARLAGQLTAITCLSSTASLNGQPQAAYDRLYHAMDPAAARMDEITLWAYTVLAEIAWRLQQHATAEDHFKMALSIKPNDHYLLASYADFLLEQHRYQEAEHLLRDRIRSDGLLLRLALAEVQLEHANTGSHTMELQARMTALGLRGEARELRTRARYTLELLKQPLQALPLAQANWAVQKQPEDARLLLLAAVNSGRHEAATPVIYWLSGKSWHERGLVELIATLENSEQ